MDATKIKIKQAAHRVEQALGISALLSAGYGGVVWLAANTSGAYRDVVQPLGSAILRNGTSIASTSVVPQGPSEVPVVTVTDVFAVTPVHIAKGAVMLQAQEVYAADITTKTLNMTANSVQKVHLDGNYLIKIGEIGSNWVNASISRINSMQLPADPSVIHAAISTVTMSLEITALSLIGAAIIHVIRKQHDLDQTST
jgi:hypothetical protein